MAMVDKTWSVVFVVACFLCAGTAAAGNKLIVVMIDGCRWDYLDDPKLELKGFQRIAHNGVRAVYVNPVYPALSFPNWYSISTGLYPENHGFVNNIMYDTETGKPFLTLYEKGSKDPIWWNGAEPIWVTAEKHQKNAALYWWAGCEIEIRGVQPKICERHRYGPGTEEEKLDFLERIDDVIQLFKPPDKDRLSLALMYYGPVDYTGHHAGPMSSESRRALKDIDEILNEMLDRIEKSGLKDQINLMVVSDHGMTDIQEATAIELEKFAEDIKFHVSSGATSMLVPEDGMVDKLYNNLKGENISGLKIFKRQDIPESYHLKKSHLINDIFLKAEKGFYINALQNSDKRIGGISHKYKGQHGYDPEDVEDMRTIFLATGPDFPKGHTLKPISNVDLYNVMCNVLQIQPLPNNGSSEILKNILSGGGDSSYFKSSSHSSSVHILCYFLPYFTFVFVLLTSQLRK